MVSLLFGFQGRINRAQYWTGICISGFGGMMLFFLLGLLMMPAGNAVQDSMNPIAAMHLMSSMGVAFGLPLTLMGWIGSALQVKRFHDRGRSGLWALAPMVPAFMLVSTVVSGIMTGAHPGQVLSSAMTWLMLLQLVQLVMIVDLGFMPSKPGPNKYGNPPTGGVTGGGAPLSGGSPIPGAPSRAGAQPIPGMGSTLASAESAIERAIAERGKQASAPAVAPQRAARAPMSAPGGVQTATPGSFGRRVSR